MVTQAAQSPGEGAGAGEADEAVDSAARRLGLQTHLLAARS